MRYHTAGTLILVLLCVFGRAELKAVGQIKDVSSWYKSSLSLHRILLLPAIRRAGSGCTLGSKLTHAAAWALCSAAGIGIKSSTGRIGCRDVGCTSLEQVRCNTVLDIIAFKKASGCQSVVITGGTEKGHASGAFSHYNGYKLDIALTSCIGSYIQANFRYSGKRPDGAEMYTDNRGNVYALEKNHWDILYYK